MRYVRFYGVFIVLRNAYVDFMGRFTFGSCVMGLSLLSVDLNGDTGKVRKI